MLKRTLTGSLILLVVALAILSRSVSIYFFDLFVMVISFIATYEVIKVNLQEDSKIEVSKKNLSYSYLALVYCYCCYLSYSMAKSIFTAILYQIIAFMLIFMVSFIIDLIYLANLRRSGVEIEQKYVLRSTKVLSKLMLYPATLLGTLYGFGINGMSVSFGTIMIITIFAVTMCTDVFAYLFGMAFHKGVLASQISPKKSISGLIGGLIGGLVGASAVFLICQFALKSNPFAAYSLCKTIVFFSLVGVFGSIFTQIGDLVASAIKREVGVKDYGKIFPGHGGMMDRVDGLMFTSTVVLIISTLIFFI